MVASFTDITVKLVLETELSGTFDHCHLTPKGSNCIFDPEEATLFAPLSFINFYFIGSVLEFKNKTSSELQLFCSPITFQNI